MSFATKDFFLFLPIVLLVYHGVLRRRSRKFTFLLLASWVFYMWWNAWLIWVLWFTTAVDYAAGRLIEGAPTPRARRAWLLVSVTSNVAFLAFFKYSDFLLRNAAGLVGALYGPAPDWSLDVFLPIGLSFHTFQGISYTVEVYRRQIPAVRSLRDFALFIAFFPQLVEGPIVRATQFLPQMAGVPRVGARRVEEGLHWFVCGLFKKVFIADQLAFFVDPVFAHPELYDAVTHRWAVLGYAAQIYCDFSGYSEMAVGCAKWLGFDLPRNFQFPFVATSISDFWRRWHMTLSSWLRDYVYIPLGGNRAGEARTALNLVATMTLCGLWHGARWNFVLWGFYNGVLLVLHRWWRNGLAGVPAAERIRRSAGYQVVALGVTLVLVLAGFVVVRGESWSGCWLMQRSFFGAAAAGQTWVPAWVPGLIALVAAGHVLGALGEHGVSLLDRDPAVRAAVYVAALALLVVYGPWSTESFLYFQF